MILSFINQKGGVGKTTSAVNISAYLGEAGYNVLLIDLDSQANASNALGINTTVHTVYDILTDRLNIVRDNLVHNTCIEHLKVLPSCRLLAGVEIELSSITEGRETILSKKLEEVKSAYDFIIIDCPPTLGTITVNALATSDGVIIPMQCEYLSMLGLSQLMYTIRQTKKYLNPSLRVEGIILTMYDKRSRLTLEVQSEIVKYFGDKVFATTIPRNVRLAEAPSFGLPIVRYAGDSKGAIAYKTLTDELIERAIQDNTKTNVS